MKTFYGDDGNCTDIPLEKVLDMMTDEWIDDNITGANVSELRDVCRKLLDATRDVKRYSLSFIKDKMFYAVLMGMQALITNDEIINTKLIASVAYDIADELLAQEYKQEENI